MRTLIVKAILRAVSVFLIIYFVILGFQYVGWEKERKAYFLEHPITAEANYDYNYAVRDDRTLPDWEYFSPDLWPFNSSWAMGLWYKFTEHI